MIRCRRETKRGREQCRKRGHLQILDQNIVVFDLERDVDEISRRTAEEM